MARREIKIGRSYDPKTQAKIGLFAAQLDDQLAKLKKQVWELTVEQLEWQQRPGMNTVGMLLAHEAVVEVWWIKIAPNNIPWEPKGKALMLKICGVEDDGLPLPPDGVHPEYLRGFTADQYLAVLTRSRRAIHSELKKWRDKDLDSLFKLGKNQYSRMWALYHVLEHFAAHFGQMLIIMHQMRDAGVLAKREND